MNAVPAADTLELPFAVPLAANVPATGLDPVPEFTSADRARRALVIHAVAAHQLADERPALLLAARAAGLADKKIQEITGVPSEEIDALPDRPSVPVIDAEVRNQYAVLLYHRAMAVAAGAGPITDGPQREYMSGYVDAVYQEASGLRTAAGQAEPFGDVLLSRATQLRAYCALLREEGPDEERWRRRGWFDAAGRIAAELALVRNDGIDALNTLFTAQELAAPYLRAATEPAGPVGDVPQETRTAA